MAKVLFQSTNPQVFRATLVGYLYEIVQRHQVVLLIEKVDSDTQRMLEDKSLFPGLEKIIFFESPFYGNLFHKTYRLRRVLREAVREYKPDIVVAPSDIWPAEMYLMRFAKKAGAVTVALQSGFKIAGDRKLYVWSCLVNAYMRMPHVLPFPIRLLLVKMRKYLGHFLYYWILPLTAGEMLFLGKTSFVFWDESSGLRDADYVAVFSKRDYDLCVKDGVPSEKLFVIGHPLEHAGARKFFEKMYFSQHKETQNHKTLTIMWSDEGMGFREQDHSVISRLEMRENRKKVVGLLAEKLPDWKIFIKPHPSVGNISEAQKFFGEVPNNVSIVDPTEPADKYIEMSNVIVGVPLPSTTLFTAQKQHPEKVILSLNLNREFLGDSYKNFDGIEYIDKEERLGNVLDSFRRNTYRKTYSAGNRFDFSDTNELLQHILQHK